VVAFALFSSKSFLDGTRASDPEKGIRNHTMTANRKLTSARQTDWILRLEVRLSPALLDTGTAGTIFFHLQNITVAARTKSDQQ
jgi:hypothetical protein